MIKIDLITGFLGSGKTTFIKQYAQFFIRKGQRIGILENDFGAVNVDIMLLQELQGPDCELETVAGACDADCHKRRFKTKLIAMAMSGYDRVIVEPSGIFDTDEFFDTLREDPLENWYEIGTVLTVVDSGISRELSEQSEYILASQAAGAGMVILSKSQLYSKQEIQDTVQFVSKLTKEKCGIETAQKTMIKPWHEMTEKDFQALSESGYEKADFVKNYSEESGYGSLYYMHKQLSAARIRNICEVMFGKTEQYGRVYRVKGFFMENDRWYECNADMHHIQINEADSGQDIVIVIGECLKKQEIDSLFTL